ncbi:hypothetical protein J6590_034808 [Homalodisca vitripennis]|nr:hypothetical protein J6590_034808 [Homalodisca vitripennis]
MTLYYVSVMSGVRPTRSPSPPLNTRSAHTHTNTHTRCIFDMPPPQLPRDRRVEGTARESLFLGLTTNKWQWQWYSTRHYPELCRREIVAIPRPLYKQMAVAVVLYKTLS